MMITKHKSRRLKTSKKRKLIKRNHRKRATFKWQTETQEKGKREVGNRVTIIEKIK